MKKKSRKASKPKDRFDEVLEAVTNLDRKAGLQHDDLKHHIGLVSEQVAGNSEQINDIREEISKLTEMVDMLRMNLKLKADNLELITLSRRVAVLEKKLVNRR